MRYYSADGTGSPLEPGMKEVLLQACLKIKKKKKKKHLCVFFVRLA